MLYINEWLDFYERSCLGQLSEDLCCSADQPVRHSECLQHQFRAISEDWAAWQRISWTGLCFFSPISEIMVLSAGSGEEWITSFSPLALLKVIRIPKSSCIELLKLRERERERMPSVYFVSGLTPCLWNNPCKLSLLQQPHLLFPSQNLSLCSSD